MIKVGDIVELKIEKLTYGTSAISRFGDEKFVVFVENVVVGDLIKAKVISINKSYAKAQMIEIIEPSLHRIKPYCPIFNACGSCQFQNYDYDFLIEQKEIILKDIFCDIPVLPIIKSPVIEGYRHKIQYPCRQTKNSKRILMGYFKNRSHDITNIKFCPAQPAIVNDIVQFIRDNYKNDCYSEKNYKGFLKNVLFRISKNGDILLTFVVNSKKYNKEFEILSQALSDKFSCIKGIFVNFNPDKTNKILGNRTLKIKGEDFILETLKDKTYKIGPESFFQVNPHQAQNLFDIVNKNIKENSNILDAYSGVGAIGIYISKKADKITFVEENKNAIEMTKENLKINNIQNYELFEGDAKAHFERFLKEKRKFDYVILDPPRSGVEKEILNIISKLAKNLIYVSCNPLTLKRDIQILSDLGYFAEFIQGVDMFPYTYHIESVCVLKKLS